MAKIYNYENALLQVLATGSQHTSRHGITEEGHLQIGAAPQSLDSRNTLKISLGWLSYSDFKVDSLKTIITWHLNLLFNTMNRFIQIERFLYTFF